jgi:hypothetical protein
VALLKAPSKKPKTTTLQVRLEEEVKLQLENYAEFIDATPSYVMSEALKLLFKKDGEFKRWLDQHPTNGDEQEIEGAAQPSVLAQYCSHAYGDRFADQQGASVHA